MTDQKNNIWRYADKYSPFIEEGQRLTLGEGGVRCVEIDAINDELSTDAKRRFIFKREDENPNGSHKDRALAYQVSYYNSIGKKILLISSSGNAAISAAAYASLAGITLIAFVDRATPKAKIDEIKKTGQEVLYCEKPINFAKYAARVFDIPNLRPSHDDLSIEPYQSIAFELAEEFAGTLDAVFMFPTSASSLIGTIKGYLSLKESRRLIKPPKVIAVQTGDITSIARHYVTEPHDTGGKSVGALGVKSTRRTEEALEHLRMIDGSALIVTAEEIDRAHGILRMNGIATSEEGAATLAGAIKRDEIKISLCVLSGKEREETGEEVPGTVYHAESYTDVKDIVGKILDGI